MFRALRPGLRDVNDRLDRLETALSRAAFGGHEPIVQWRGGLHGQAVDPRGNDVPHLTAKYRDELSFWTQFVRHDAQKSIGGPFEEVYGRWQRDRIAELGAFLGLPPGGVDAWCAERSAVEIGAGPFPSIAVARWKRAVAVDPLADGYAAEGLLPTGCHCDRVTYLAAPGESVPLPSGFADIVVIENCLDHVDDPRRVVKEIWRLLRPGGHLWLLVDLMSYSDHLHPNPFSEITLRALLTSEGYMVVKDRVSDHKSHPQAYGEYRGLLLKPARTRTNGSLTIEVPIATRATAAV
jgi:SAM-dependent methyltransferase